MMTQILLQSVKVTRVMNAVAAGTSDQNGDAVDMFGFDGVLFLGLFGALTANQVTSMKAQQSSDDADADAYADIEGSSVGPMADSDGNQCLILDVSRPMERYVRPVVNRGTANAVIDGVLAIQYNADQRPTVQDVATIMASKSVIEAGEGTA